MKTTRKHQAPTKTETPEHSWADELSATDLVAFQVAVRIRRLELYASKAVSDRVTERGLSEGDVDILAHLFEAGTPFTLLPSQLAKMCLITSGAVTGRVNRLVAAGFAVRSPSSADGRLMAVTATPTGITFAAELARSLTQSRLHRAITSLGKKRMGELQGLLASIDDQLAD